MLELFAYLNYLLHFYIILDELVEVGEYKDIDKVILIGEKVEALLLNLLLKNKGIRVVYINEKLFLNNINNLVSKNSKLVSKTKYFITADCRKAIECVKQKDVFLGQYIISPICKER